MARAPASRRSAQRLADAEAGLKAAAARRALELVEDGMLLGLGSGTTAGIFIRLLGERVRSAGLRVRGVPTSSASAQLAAEGGIPVLHSIDRPIDLAVDGADEIDPALNLLKGRGGALVREKLVAASARRFVVVADASKLVDQLGVGVLPVEVIPFLWHETARRLESMGLRWRLRGGEEQPFVTDNGNLILDLSLPAGIPEPVSFGSALKAITGVVEHGLFCGMATGALVAGPEGVRELGRLA
jgi:ribose 5-phosphate isomerase A